MQRLRRTFLYALVVVLTFSTEDTFFLLRLEGRERSLLFRDCCGSLEPVLGVLVFAMILTFLSSSFLSNSFLFRLNILLSIAILFGIAVGVVRDDRLNTSLFEFRYWRSLVFFALLTVLMYRTWKSGRDLKSFINWFILIQTIYACYVLFKYIALGKGQMTNFGRIVPVFAGDELAFLALAYFLLSAYSLYKTKLLSVSQLVIVLLVLLLSLRRMIMAAAVGGIALNMASMFLRLGLTKKIFMYSVFMLIFLAGFLITVSSLNSINTEFVLYRFETISPFTSNKYGFDTTSGHTGDFLDGWDLIKSSPVVGKGLDSYFPLNRTANWQGDSSLHTTLFSMWVKMGLPGLVLYLFIVTYGARFIFNRPTSLPQDLHWLVDFVISFSVFNFAATIYMNGFFLGWKNAMVLALYMSICVFLTRYRR